MVDKKISALDPAAALDGTELLEVSQIIDGTLTARKATAQAIANLGGHKGHIDGLKMEWVSGTSLRVTSGSAYIESLGYAVELTTAITKASLVLTANTWYHVYLFDSAGTLDIEIVTDAPAAPYSGTARSKSADTSRRYVGSVRTDGDATINNFAVDGATVTYKLKVDGNSDFRVLSAGTSTTRTTVSLATSVPITSRLATVRWVNTAQDFAARTGTSDDSVVSTGGIFSIAPDTSPFGPHPTDSAQEIYYRMQGTPASGGLFLDVYGYTYER